MTGSPGVGKATWLLYPLWKLAREKKTVVFQLDEQRRVLFTRGGAVQGDYCAFAEELADREAYYLVSNHKPDAAHARTILACPEDNNLYRRFSKTSTEKIMPPWTRE